MISQLAYCLIWSVQDHSKSVVSWHCIVKLKPRFVGKWMLTSGLDLCLPISDIGRVLWLIQGLLDFTLNLNELASCPWQFMYKVWSNMLSHCLRQFTLHCIHACYCSVIYISVGSIVFIMCTCTIQLWLVMIISTYI